MLRTLRSSTWSRKSGTPVFLLLNKIDLLADKRNLLPLITQFQNCKVPSMLSRKSFRFPP